MCNLFSKNFIYLKKITCIISLYLASGSGLGGADLTLSGTYKAIKISICTVMIYEQLRIIVAASVNKIRIKAT